MRLMLLLSLSSTTCRSAALLAHSRPQMPHTTLAAASAGSSSLRHLCMMGGGGGGSPPTPPSKKKVAKKRAGARAGAGGMRTQAGSRADNFPYTGRMRPGVQSPTRAVPASIALPDYAKDGRPAGGPMLPWQIEVKSAKDIEGMRAAGRVAREVLDAAIAALEVGATTDSIDALVHEETVRRGAYPSPLNYHGFPKSCCTSVNEVICHGIPDSSVLRDGDIVNVDVTCYYGGYHGDLSATFAVGQVDEAGRRLVKVTTTAGRRRSTTASRGAVQGHRPIIEEHVAPYGTRRPHFCGHGIGKVFHTTPNILHYKNNEPGKMEVGHVFTIEPMICEGTSEHVEWKDKWTATTRDGRRSAQFEHTLLVTETGVEAFTGRLPTSKRFWWEEE